jgi:hypothetical protein
MIEGYDLIGFEICDNGEPESGYDKIAIYVEGGDPVHVARLTPSGRWASKLGDFEDIEHEALHDVDDGIWDYGVARQFMRRPRP